MRRHWTAPRQRKRTPHAPRRESVRLTSHSTPPYSSLVMLRSQKQWQLCWGRRRHQGSPSSSATPVPLISRGVPALLIVDLDLVTWIAPFLEHTSLAMWEELSRRGSNTS